MTIKKSKLYGLDGENVSFSFIDEELIGMSLKNSAGIYVPEDNTSNTFSAFKQSDEALDAFRKAVFGSNKNSYSDLISYATDEKMTQHYLKEKKKFDNAEYVTGDFQKPRAIAYNTNIDIASMGNASKIYAYPYDINLGQDHLKITRYEYKRNSLNASMPPREEYLDEYGDAIKKSKGEGNKRKLEGGTVLGDLIGSIILPMPKVTDVNAADWGKSELNAQGLAALGLAASVTGIPGETGEEKQKRMDALRGREEDGSAFRQTTGAIKNQIVAKTAGLLLGTELNADTVLARKGGVVLNPNAEMLFQGPALRDFSFKYRMVARSQKEGKMIRNIIRFLKLGMAAKFRSRTYLKSPDVFTLAYMRRDGEKKFKMLDTVNRFSPGGLALTSLNTDYAPNTYWSAYGDSQPVEVTLEMSFAELRPIYEQDQLEAPTDSVGY